MGRSTGERHINSETWQLKLCFTLSFVCLQKTVYHRGKNLQVLRDVIEDICNQIMWVNDREEEELMFDWGDKNIDSYIPKKQESYSVRHTQTWIRTCYLMHSLLKSLHHTKCLTCNAKEWLSSFLSENDVWPGRKGERPEQTEGKGGRPLEEPTPGVR